MTSGEETTVKGWLWMVLGLLGLVLGAVWTLQGLNVLEDSGVMSGVRIWAIIGPIVGIIGLVLIIVGVNVRGRAKRHLQQLQQEEQQPQA
jgi:type VI protein secretion system component VasK